MKIKDIASKYKIDGYEFEKFILDSNLPHTKGVMSISIDDYKVEKYVERFKEYDKKVKAERSLSPEEKARIEARKLQAQLQEREARLSKIRTTSSHSFDGYRITTYSGCISASDVIAVDRWYKTDESVKLILSASLAQIQRNALQNLKEEAYKRGCNAVIGVDFDHITLDPQTANGTGGTTYQPYIFCAMASGTAVVIEKTED